MHKVVFHIDEPEKWHHTLSNVTNLVDYGKDNQESYEIVVLVNGDAIMGYLDETLRNSIEQFSKEGIHFHACNNSMSSHHVKATDLPENVEIVPAGVADLISLQERGFEYVKA